MKAIEFDYDAKAEMTDASCFYEDRRKGLGVSFLREVADHMKVSAYLVDNADELQPE